MGCLDWRARRLLLVAWQLDYRLLLLLRGRCGSVHVCQLNKNHAVLSCMLCWVLTAAVIPQLTGYAEFPHPCPCQQKLLRCAGGARAARAGRRCGAIRQRGGRGAAERDRLAPGDALHRLSWRFPTSLLRPTPGCTTCAIPVVVPWPFTCLKTQYRLVI